MEVLSKNQYQYDYQKAFSRNLGWLTPDEQLAISKVKVGIAGLGGVGGQYIEILSRLGVQNFSIADFDTFSIENTNRQNECRIINYDRKKIDVMSELICDINPLAQVKGWREGIKDSDIDKFCNEIDIYLDGLDFFEVNLRSKIFRKMKELNKPALTAGPTGCGTTMIVFDQDSMSFDDHFGINDDDQMYVKYAKFLIGLDTGFHASYLVDPTRLNLKERKAPSLPMGVYSCASIMASTFFKMVLKRGPIYKSPYVFHYDPYLLKSAHHKIYFGYKNPLQKLKLKILLKRLGSITALR